MPSDLVLDTHILSDFIAEYYRVDVDKGRLFKKGGILSNRIVDILNEVIKDYEENGAFSRGLIVTSAFSFIEITRKFDEVSKGAYSIIQLKAFIENHPDWFYIIEVDESLYEFFYRVPAYVYDEGVKKNIEWPDAVHCATVLSRDMAFLVTRDQRIQKIDIISCME